MSRKATAMPISRGRSGTTPIYYTYPATPANMAPNSPSSPTKAVHFAPLPSETTPPPSRPLSRDEAYQLYDFEFHASNCTACYEPYRVIFSEHGQLCDLGRSYAAKASLLIYHDAGDYYFVPTVAGAQPIRVQSPPNYYRTFGLLKALDRLKRRQGRQSRPAARIVPIIDYPARRPRSPSPVRRRQTLYDERNLSHASIIVEPATSERGRDSTTSHRRSHRRSHHPSKRYNPIVVQDNWSMDGNDDDADDDRVDVETRPSPIEIKITPSTKPAEQKTPLEPSTAPRERRGNLYESDMARRRNEKHYRVEIHTPDSERWRRSRRDSVWP